MRVLVSVPSGDPLASDVRSQHVSLLAEWGDVVSPKEAGCIRGSAYDRGLDFYTEEPEPDYARLRWIAGVGL